MILKGSQRAGGADLAAHLLNEATNERIELAEVSGTVSHDLAGAFAEYEAVACGTRCKEPLYSLSINPSAPLTREQYAAAIAHIEERLGLQGRARAVVFHDKNEREHCHVVWCRIDTDKMRAVHMGHDHQKLRAISRDLAEKFGLDLPPGLAQDRGAERFGDAPQMSFGEKEQAELTGITLAQRRAEITKAYKSADNAKAFMAALEERGYYLARGDRRDFVVVDRYGQAHSLPRQIEGAKTKDVRQKLAPLTPEQLPSVDQVRATIAARERGERQRHQAKIELASAQIRKRLQDRQASRRAELNKERQAIKIRQASERLSLHAAQKAANDSTAFKRAAQAPTGLMAFLQRVSGIGAIINYHQRRQDLTREQRQKEENASLRRRHENEDMELAGRSDALARIERKESQSLDKNILRRARIAVRQAEQKTARTMDDFTQPRQTTGGQTKSNSGIKPSSPGETRVKHAAGLAFDKARDWIAHQESLLTAEQRGAYGHLRKQHDDTLKMKQEAQAARQKLWEEAWKKKIRKDLTLNPPFRTAINSRFTLEQQRRLARQIAELEKLGASHEKAQIEFLRKAEHDRQGLDHTKGVGETSRDVRERGDFSENVQDVTQGKTTAIEANGSDTRTDFTENARDVTEGKTTSIEGNGHDIRSDFAENAQDVTESKTTALKENARDITKRSRGKQGHKPKSRGYGIRRT